MVLEEQTLVWAYLDLHQSLDLAFVGFFVAVVVMVEPFFRLDRLSHHQVHLCLL